MIGDATISEDGRYRYRLSRRWGPGPTMLFALLNPSTADGTAADPTLRRCIGFAAREGCEALEIVNPFALRASRPAKLLEADDPVGPENLEHLRRAGAVATGGVVLGWGAHPIMTRAIVARTLEAIYARTPALGPRCLGVTKSGAPRHPLYVRGDAPLVPWALS